VTVDEKVEALEPKAAEALFTSADLRGLCLSLQFYRRENLQAFLDLPWLSRLTSLELKAGVWRGWGIVPDDLRLLAAAPGLAGLVHLSLGGGLDPNWVGPITESLHFPALASLAIEGCSIGDRALQTLTARMPPGLRRLRLNRGVGVSGVRILASSPALAGLEHLDLSSSRADIAGAESLAASPFLANLSTLVLDSNTLLNKGARALASSPFLTRLGCLGLRKTELHDDGVRALARSANLAGLTVLDLGGNNRVGEAGVRALAQSPHLAGLRALSLRGIPLTPAAVGALAGSPHRANLDTLVLASTGIDGPSAKLLLASPHLNNLAALDLEGNNLPPAVKGAVPKRWPFARL
jgi:hypothetical protein